MSSANRDYRDQGGYAEDQLRAEASAETHGRSILVVAFFEIIWAGTFSTLFALQHIELPIFIGALMLSSIAFVLFTLRNALRNHKANEALAELESESEEV